MMMTQPSREEEATRMLQRAWRRTLQPRSTRAYAERFLRLGLGALPRRALLERISTPCTTKAMHLLLDRVQRLCSIAMRQPQVPMAPGTVGTLRHAYIAAATATPRAFKAGPGEQIATTRRTVLLRAFEGIARTVPTTLTAAGATGFLAALGQYAQSMKQQHMLQFPLMIVRSQRVLLSLHGALEQLRDDPDHAETLIALRERIAHTRAGLARRVQPAAMARLDEEMPTGVTNALHLQHVETMSNETIGHELFLDQGFQIRHDGDDAPRRFDPRIRELTAETAMRLTIDDDVVRQTPPSHTRLLLALGEIRSSLQDIIIPIGAQQAVDLDDALNVGRIRADLARGRGVDVRAISRVVMRLLGREGASPPGDGGVAATVAFLVKQVHDRRIATANDRIRRIAPLFAGERNFEYERTKFQERIDGGLETPIARRWAAGGEAAHARAFASLVAGAGPLHLATLPEPLVHDIDRVERFRNEFASILRAAFEAAIAARQVPPGTPASRALARAYAEPTHPAHRLLRSAMRRHLLLVVATPHPAFVDADRFAALVREVGAVRALDFNGHGAAYH
jgi:hypothetical protein